MNVSPMRVYFDYNATTPLSPEVVEAVARATRDLFGNASSVHHYGQQAKAALDVARTAVSVLLNADPSEIVFTSGGTEADNFALRGAAEALEPTGRRHLIASTIEHEAVLNTLKALARRGWKTTLVPVDQTGIVSPDRVREAITDETAVVSVMHANNEIGTIQPIAGIAAVAHERGALMHVDAVQSVGKIPVDVRALGVDLLALSAHKFNGPKGAGALFVKRGTRMLPLVTGGKHERNRRAALPSAFLHQLIKHGEAWQDFVAKSMRASVEGIASSQREADRVFREWAVRAGLGTGSTAARAEPRRETESPSAPGDLRAEVDALRQRLRQLEEKLEKRKEIS
jgi:cysteine desulfurase